MSFSIIYLCVPLYYFSVRRPSKYIFPSFYPLDRKQWPFLFVFGLRTHIRYELGTHPLPILSSRVTLRHLPLHREQKLAIALLRVYDGAVTLIKVILSIVHVVDLRRGIVEVSLIRLLTLRHSPC